MFHRAILAGLVVIPLVLACASDEEPSFEDVPPVEELFVEGERILKGHNILGVYTYINYGKAIEAFQAIIDNYPYSELAVKAELKIADAYFQDGRYEEALSYYRDFSDLHPQHEKVPYTLLQSALCHYNQVQSVERDQTSTREALLELERLIRSHPFAEEAGRGETLLRELRGRLARNEMRIGDFYLEREEYQSAAERYRGLLNTYPGLGLEVEALFKLGVCYEHMKRQDEATRLFHVIVENFPDTIVADAAREHIEAGE